MVILNNNNPTKNYTGNAINNTVTNNYNYLLFHNYGGGNDAPWNSLVNFTQDEVGQIDHTVALAARLDYAVAANLNIWGSYMWLRELNRTGGSLVPERRRRIPGPSAMGSSASPGMEGDLYARAGAVRG